MSAIPIGSLNEQLLEQFPIWEFAPESVAADDLIRPVSTLPVSSLDGRLIATRGLLAGGLEVWILVGNLDIDDAKTSEHFLTLSVFNRGKWFHLARYHDPDFASRGPAALCRFLNLQMEEVFPIKMDMRKYCVGMAAHLQVSLRSEPESRLTKDELMALVLSRL
jgi:hypothetical protein